MKTGRPKEKGSIHSEGGFATLAVSRKTREKIKHLADRKGKHVSTYLKDIADEQLKKNEIMRLKMEALKASYSRAELLFTFIYRQLGGRKPINTGIRRTIREMISNEVTGIETK